MDFMSIQNLNGYIKNLKLQSQWSLKQQTGQYNAKGTTLEEWLGDSQRQTQETAPGDHGDDTLRKIRQKLDVGGKLTQKERDYLQEHDPEAYRELVNQEQEQKAMRRHCAAARLRKRRSSCRSAESMPLSPVCSP